MTEAEWESVTTANPYIPPESRPNALRRGGWKQGSGPTILGERLAGYVNKLEMEKAALEARIRDLEAENAALKEVSP